MDGLEPGASEASCVWVSNNEELTEMERRSRALIDMEDKLKFYPPLYIQRYEAVRAILRQERWSPPVSKIVEFGCAELAMFSYFKQITDVTNVIMVDIDSSLLEHYHCRAAPLSCDYLCCREKPLHVEVLCGSVAEHDGRLVGADAVVCIELIEHLELDIVQKMEETIFGFIKPAIAIFTTPNSDFNVLLTGLNGKYRHWDHKFEWSRAEFREWTSKVINDYPHYRVEISGVGLPPEGQENVGHCSQLALFIRDKDYCPVPPQDIPEIYKICHVYDHPGKQNDDRSHEEKLQDEVEYQLNRLGHFDCYFDEGKDCGLVPLLDLTKAVQTNIAFADAASVRCVLPPENIIDTDDGSRIVFNLYSSQSSNTSNMSDSVQDEDIEVLSENNVEREHLLRERWDVDAPLTFSEPRLLAEYHMALASIDNATNLVYERQAQFNIHLSNWTYNEDSDDDDEDDDDDDDYDSDVNSLQRHHDCERMWNSYSPLKHFVQRRVLYEDLTSGLLHPVTGTLPPNAALAGELGNCSKSNTCIAASSPALVDDKEDNFTLNVKPEPITDSGVDLSPLLNEASPKDELADIFPSKLNVEGAGGGQPKPKEFPKSTSVEVLHLDESCTLKRRAGLEYIEFTPSTSVALCYTGQTYCDLDKVSSIDNMSMSAERKSLDSSLIKDAADSCSFDFAGDSGYPNSLSLHHDVDVDLTPEQVDDISSENDNQSNQSFSEDELSESCDRVPALPRSVIRPRHPVIPIVVENVENGDLANNNRDGEGNNAVAPLGDEREFVALVQEDEMQPLLAAPVFEDIVIPNDANPFPDWLIALLRIQDKEKPVEKTVDEDECDEGLGDDSVLP